MRIRLGRDAAAQFRARARRVAAGLSRAVRAVTCRRTANGERRTANGERRTANGERRTANAPRMATGDGAAASGTARIRITFQSETLQLFRRGKQ
ncbi:hypothetical protein DIE08_02810 [Burkholderia sp. Bp9004]|nr:hypothetical protein DIE08_02810 [Burkholderia sp. Bp9004]